MFFVISMILLRKFRKNPILVMVLAGVLVAFVSGLLAIKLMVKVVTNQKLFYFSVYTWAAGALVILLSLLGIL